MQTPPKRYVAKTLGHQFTALQVRDWTEKCPRSDVNQRRLRTPVVVVGVDSLKPALAAVHNQCHCRTRSAFTVTIEPGLLSKVGQCMMF